RRIFVVLQPLKPNAGANLMAPCSDLKIVVPGKQIPAIPYVRRIVRPGSRDCRATRCRLAAGNYNPPRAASGHKREIRRIRRQRKRIEVESCPGKARPERIQRSRREDMNLLQAGYLAAELQIRSKQRI